MYSMYILLSRWDDDVPADLVYDEVLSRRWLRGGVVPAL
jgi:hypothetical protein